MIYKVGIIIFIYLFVACSSAERKEAVTVGELFRQAAFYGERLQYIPALDTYQQAIRLAEKDKDSLALSHGYLEMGKIYRNQSLKQKALQSEKKHCLISEVQAVIHFERCFTGRWGIFICCPECRTVPSIIIKWAIAG